MAGFEAGWTIELCVRDLLDQMDERIRLLCHPQLSHSLVGSSDDGEAVPSASGDKSGEAVVCARPDVALATACLGLTTPIALEYPDDAQEHFLVQLLLPPAYMSPPWVRLTLACQELQRALAPWAQRGKHRPHFAAGWAGPWIENAWAALTPGPCLAHTFGAFIPILLPWTDLWEPEM